ncbi:Zn(II)2Cys6 transcription factor [Aspergillus candidus]|uniref:Putative C6 finger domain protein n=1 Tax=Aspergillus candidus TaxID=41067 RepID=A0A2I2F5S0_ASPCN|nr:putative C6 finger domain protein [Aspergillus candidus]PLB35995.1 putative C6 finger domain protein [Aspergillus candidus]
MSRSFTGCKRCKARRQKCDEQRPACTRCATANVPCRYTMQLQWGGRAFSRSRFGACMDNGGMQRLEYSPGEFIYTTESAATEQSLFAGKPNSGATWTTTAAASPIQSQSLSRSIDPFSNLSTDQRSLLHHFLRDASQITACHPNMRHEICQMLVPRALQTPSLLYATLALSAIHLQALRSQSDNVKSAPHIARLVALSLEHFRTELQMTPQGKGSSDVLLATARTLCLAEIHSGAIHPHSWRAHIEGARALMVATETSSAEGEGEQEGEGEFRRYLDRWHRSIVSLTALTGNGPPIGEVDDVGELMTEDSPDYLDDYWGFTVRLAAVFRGIGGVAWRARQGAFSTTKVGGGDVGCETGKIEEQDADHDTKQHPARGTKQAEEQDTDHDANHDTHQGPDTATDTPTDTPTDPTILHETNTLESTLHNLISQTTTSPPTFYPGVAPRLSTECTHQLTLCNTAFQHSALIQIHRRLHRTPSSSSTVQSSVQRILACTAEIGPAPGLSPWVLLTTPLFIAGCEARGKDRECVRRLLQQLYETIRVPNVVQALRFLEMYWAGRRVDEDEGWNEFLDRMNIDFIPY